MKLDYKKRVILYFDILGFKQKFEEKDFDPIQYLATIKQAMRLSCQALQIDDKEIAIKIFSDNVCVIFDMSKEQGFLLAQLTASMIQQELLEELGGACQVLCVNKH